MKISENEALFLTRVYTVNIVYNASFLDAIASKKDAIASKKDASLRHNELRYLWRCGFTNEHLEAPSNTEV